MPVDTRTVWKYIEECKNVDKEANDLRVHSCSM